MIGIKYPLSISNGGMQLSENNNLTKDAILSVLMTQNSERVMRPLYGINNMVFNSPDSEVSGILQGIQDRLVNQITPYHPSAEFRVTGAVNDDGVLVLNIEWSSNLGGGTLSYVY